MAKGTPILKKEIKKNGGKINTKNLHPRFHLARVGIILILSFLKYVIISPDNQ